MEEAKKNVKTSNKGNSTKKTSTKKTTTTKKAATTAKKATTSKKATTTAKKATTSKKATTTAKKATTSKKATTTAKKATTSKKATTTDATKKEIKDLPKKLKEEEVMNELENKLTEAASKCPTSFTSLGLLVQFVLTVIVLMLLFISFFVSEFRIAVEIFLGMTVLSLAYNNYKIYKHKGLTLLYLVIGLYVFITSMQTYLGEYYGI